MRKQLGWTRDAGAVAVAVLFAATALVRIHGAWCYRVGTNLDHANIALMVKHMVEGTGFPVFFYGQAFMGSPEPVVSAMLCRVFGLSGFMVCMGPALLGLGISIALYRWVHAMAGRTAAAATALFLLIGPRGYYHYLASPRCYAIQMLLTVLMLWLCARGVRDLRRGAPFPTWPVFFWGLLAGIGWWSSGLILYTVAASGLLVLLWGGRRTWTWRWVWGVAGGLLGAAPWVIWNLLNGFRSLAVQGKMVGAGSTAELLYAYIGNRLFRILGVHGLDFPFNILLGAVIVLAILAALYALFSRRANLVEPDRRPDLAACLLMFPAGAFFFSLSAYSAYGSPRYHLPLVPVVAVCLGLLTKALSRKIGILGWIPLAALVCTQVLHLPRAIDTSHREAELTRHVDALHEVMQEQGLTEAYATPFERWMSFYLREQVIFTPFRAGGYLPHAQRAERAERVAIVNNHEHFSAFLAPSGGRATLHQFGPLQLHVALQPPPPATLLTGAIRTIAADPGQDVTAALTDFDAATGWAAPEGREMHSLQLAVDPQSTLSGIRLVFRCAWTPSRWRVEGLAAGSDRWEPLVAESDVTPYHWSGNRVYGPGPGYRLEARFAPGRFERLRIALRGNTGRWHWLLQEAQLLTPASPVTQDDADRLAQTLVQDGISRVYADRWLANRLLRDGRFDVPTPLYFLERERAMMDLQIRMESASAIVVPAAEASRLVSQLDTAGIAADVQPFGSLAILRLAPPSDNNQAPPPFEWRGWGMLRHEE